MHLKLKLVILKMPFLVFSTAGPFTKFISQLKVIFNIAGMQETCEEEIKEWVMDGKCPSNTEDVLE